MMNLTKFYDQIRPHLSLTTQNVQGFDRILHYLESKKTQINSAAYLLATAWWETNKQMWPIKEAYWLSETWRKNNLRYYPWYGRGLIQVTWKENYIKVARMIGVPETTFTNDPDKLMEWQYALPALLIGAQEGIYTGKGLDDYIDDIDESDAEDHKEYVAARRVVNGTDKAATIANLALKFEDALRFAGYGKVEPEKETPKDDAIRLYDLGGVKLEMGPGVARFSWTTLKRKET